MALNQGAATYALFAKTRAYMVRLYWSGHDVIGATNDGGGPPGKGRITVRQMLPEGVKL